MPQLDLKHNSIADVYLDENGYKRVKINCNEEDFFKMLDSVNPKILIKYLDMRHIPHRDAMNINFFTTKNKKLAQRNVNKITRIVDDYNALCKSR